VGRSLYEGKTTVYVESTAPGISRWPSCVCQGIGQDLRELQIKEGGLLYVDDLLIYSPDQGISNADIVLVLNFLADRGYRVSKHKAQISLQEVCYLGYILTPGAQRLSTE
jgi:hypothetical protein